MPRWQFGRFNHESVLALHFDYDFASDLGSHSVMKGSIYIYINVFQVVFSIGEQHFK